MIIVDDGGDPSEPATEQIPQGSSKPPDDPEGLAFECHNRRFDLTEAQAVFGTHVASRIGSTLRKHFLAIARPTAIERYRNFDGMLRWVAEQLVVERKTPGSGSDWRPTEASSLQAAVHQWFSFYRKESNAGATSHAETLNHVGRCLDVLAEGGILPPIVRPRMPRNYHRDRKPRSTMAEVSRSAMLESPWRTIREAMTAGVDDDEADRYLATLQSEIDAESMASSTELIEAIRKINLSRLELIRAEAEQKLLHWIDIYNVGQEYISKGDHIQRELAERFKVGERTAVEKVRSILDCDDLETAKCNFAGFVFRHYGGLLPTENSFGSRSVFQRLMRRFGGATLVRGWFGAHEEAVAAAAFIYMIDSAANNAVALALPPDCESDSDETGMANIRSRKDRPVPKDILETLPVKDARHKFSAVQALREIRRMTDIYRRLCPSLSDYLLVYRYFGTPSLANQDFLHNHLKYLLRETELFDLPINPSSFRPSVLLKVAFDHGGSVAAVAARGDHSGNGVAEGYTMRYPIRLLYVQKIRKFMQLFQVSVIFDIPGACEALGLRLPEAENLLAHAERTGLGLSCRNSRLGVQPGSTVGETCTQIDCCLECEMQLFHATAENVADVLLLQQHLLISRAEWEATRPERWAAVWLNYLAFAEVVLEKIRRSPYARILVEAERIATRLRESGYQLAPLF